MGYRYCNGQENGRQNRGGCNNNQSLNNFRKLVKAFLAAHKDFENKLGEASNLANEALDALKESAAAYACSLKYAEKIANWIEKYGSDYDYNFEGCEDLAKELENLLCEMNKEMKDALRTLCEAVKDIKDVKELDNEFDNNVEAYVECIKDNSDDGCGCNRYK